MQTIVWPVIETRSRRIVPDSVQELGNPPIE